MSHLRFSFLCGLRGYHKYRSVWTPSLHEVLPARHEASNPHDQYAIACMKILPGGLFESVVGHLPKEVSRFTRFIILHGARVSAKIVAVNHRRSPLVQGGLEIPVEVTVEMDFSEDNKISILKYEALVNERYKEPIDGKFEDATQSILEDLKLASDEEDSGSELELEI